MFVDQFSRRIALTILGLWLLSAGAAKAQTCPVKASRYDLQEDIVRWSMTIVNGRNCVRGIRFASVVFSGLKLISPPQFGEVALRGAGFIYSPKHIFTDETRFL